MRNFKTYLSYLAVFALLLTSCSKDEPTDTPNSEKASLSFGAMVEDLADRSSDKQSDISDLPECGDDVPAYVEIVLLDAETEAEVVGTEAEPFRVDLVAGQVFTEEVPELELEPGTYTLDHFSVYNADGELIWLAPKGGVLAEFVETSLPMDINLGAGVKKYVDVSVLCYDDRDVNEYGYMFFELDTNEAFEFCFFANYCTPEGRHYPARYSVDISIDGETIYEGEVNTTGVNDDDDWYAEPLCFALPDLEEYADDEEYIDYTVTLLDWEGAYGDVEQMVQTGSLSRAEIMANFRDGGEVEYEHLRFGCDGDTQQPVDSDGDGIIDSEDDCPNVNPETDADNDGCEDETGTTDSDGDGVTDTEDDCPNTAEGVTVDEFGCPIEVTCDIEGPDAGCNEVFLQGEDGWVLIEDPSPDFSGFYALLESPGATNPYATVTIDLVDGDPVFQVNTTGEYQVQDYVIEVSQAGDDNTACLSDENIAAVTGDQPDVELDFVSDFNYPFYARIKANVCPTE